MRHFLPLEYVLPIAFLGVVCLLLGKKRLGLTLLATSFLMFAFPVYYDFIKIFLPGWMIILLSVFTVIAAFRFILKGVIGKVAADQTTGTLAADAIRYAIKLPFVLLAKLVLLVRLAVGDRANVVDRSDRSS